MLDYRSFIKKYGDKCLVYLCYIKEAHFVERDQEGKYVDGWPIGYKEYEYP